MSSWENPGPYGNSNDNDNIDWTPPSPAYSPITPPWSPITPPGSNTPEPDFPIAQQEEDNYEYPPWTTVVPSPRLSPYVSEPPWEPPVSSPYGGSALDPYELSNVDEGYGSSDSPAHGYGAYEEPEDDGYHGGYGDEGYISQQDWNDEVDRFYGDG